MLLLWYYLSIPQRTNSGEPTMATTKAEAAAASKARILEGAQDLIMSRGYAAMTVDAICQSAGITKGGFFHHFANKEALGEAVLTKFWADVEERQAIAPYHAKTNAVEFLEGYIDHAILSYQDPKLQQGCMLAIFTMELAESNQALFEIASTHFATWRKELIEMFNKVAEQTGQSIDAQTWSDFYISTLEGALLLAKASGDPKSITRSLTLYKKLLIDSISKS
jgi:TetR/AcrR family transcriptional regulator, transcriptional repressor for nem operon